MGLWWLAEVRFRALWGVTFLLFVTGVVYGLLSPSTTPAGTYSMFLFILAFPLCSTAFENAVLELKSPVSRIEYSLALLISYLVVLLLPLVPFALTKNFLSAVLVVVSGVSAGLFFGSIGLGPKLSALIPIIFIITFISLARFSPLLPVFNPVLAVYRGIPYQLVSIFFYSLLYFLVMKKREWRA